MPGQSAIHELDGSLCDQGLELNSVSVASAFLGLTRQRGWLQSAPAEGMAWLADLACEVLKPGLSNSPLLAEFQQRLEDNGVAADPRKVAAAILGVALDEQWHDEPSRMISWLERLAVEVVQLPPAKTNRANDNHDQEVLRKGLRNKKVAA